MTLFTAVISVAAFLFGFFLHDIVGRIRTWWDRQNVFP